MATLDDVRRIAATLPGTVEGEPQFALSVKVKGKHKGYVWAWAERVEPKKPKVINHDVLAVRVPSLLAKEIILSSDPSIYFTEDHYNNYPAVLVRLPVISAEDLRPLIEEAWKCMVPAKVATEWMQGS